jgi:uncharacterized protein YndB with AHSA1/START domain
MTTTTATATQVFQLFIKASPEAIWEAITKPEFTALYFHGSRIEVGPDRVVSHGPRGDLRRDDEVFEYDPPRRLVHSWQSLYDPELADEPPSRVAWEIEAREGGFSKLTVIHDRLEASPKTAARVSGDGWMLVLSGLKTLLETREPLDGSPA